jgi:D-tyrosyl-tRNA(Tyr) deacylase
MRIVIQRVKEAKVLVDEKVVGSISSGALVFFGSHKEDEQKEVLYLVNKLVNLRMFADSEDKMNISLVEAKKELLVISQFTLYADCQTGRRPSFTDTAPPEIAKTFYDQFIQEAKKMVPKVETGVFGAKMEVRLINDGPVTFIIDAKKM